MTDTTDTRQERRVRRPQSGRRAPQASALAWQVPLALALAVVGTMATGLSLALLPMLYLAAVTPALASSDARSRRLPNRLVLPAIALGIAANGGLWFASGKLPVTALAAGAASFAFLLLLAALGGMGMGDVKLGA